MSPTTLVGGIAACILLQGFFSGATVLGDGSVSLILDVAGLAQRANSARIASMTAL
jgi:chemotaxis protein histidine kinase CheA